MKKLSFHLYEMFFKTLSNKTRFEIVRVLAEKPHNVTDICKKTKFEQSRVSHNLKKLERCGFITCEIVGKKRIYSIDKDLMLPIIKNIDKYIEKYDERLKVCVISVKK